MDKRNTKSVELCEDAMEEILSRLPVQLCKDVMEEILSRLPVKSVGRFRCVSKSWLSLLTSDGFIKNHFEKLTNNKSFAHHKVIFEGVGKGSELNECSLQPFLNEELVSSIKPFPSPCRPSPMYNSTNNNNNNNTKLLTRVLGCCNGLICFRSQNRSDIFICNPATMIFMKLPKLEYTWAVYGFGNWDGAYKVFAGSYECVREPNHKYIRYEGNLYNSKTNSWKTVCQLPPLVSVPHKNDVFASGKIFWITWRSESNKDICIDAFDLESEELGRIELPFKAPRRRPPRHYMLAEIGGCLHLLYVHHGNDRDDQYVVVWVMKEESESESRNWLKLFDSPLDFKLQDSSINKPLFTGGPNGEILIIFQKNFLVYNAAKDNAVRTDKHNIKFYGGHVYVESLISPNFTKTCRCGATDEGTKVVSSTNTGEESN